MKRICILMMVAILTAFTLNACMSSDNDSMPYENSQVGKGLYSGYYDGCWTVNGEKTDSVQVYVGAYVDISNMPRTYVFGKYYHQFFADAPIKAEKDYGFPLHYTINGVSHDSYYFAFEHQNYSFRYVARDTTFTSIYVIKERPVAIYNRYSNSFVIKIKISSITDSYVTTSDEMSDGKQESKSVSLKRPVPELSLVFTGTKRKESNR